ncbi:rhomboid family intramembrane serine protease [Polaribacter sp.]|jgi:membrane associated rhomboid family serine protease|uniref:rhomboid family intramembrane serine protease n=1 Tax=uncultured Polaribacter sp. TaxID=174711 RepID=UPI00233B4400|nr:rhomboid family intramembrane serine protease [Polaribacter sp.]MDB4204548.1 rhomboid family intramembrane serine protease [Polaribacter sp.]MDC1236933.1 rhomboid family intramembrane serine protease [Polaribacter sp.]|tara:strand:+ start:530 stop:1237 length:708 start_codon:yes stop_codon:yes gene_type:complete
MNKLTDGIKHLIIINVILFVAPQLLQLDFTNMLALHFPENEHFGFWQYITHMFMHASFSHILFNMYGLWAFGTPLEQMWGRKKFLFFYFSAGLGAGIIYTLVNYYQFNAALETLVTSGISQNEILELMNPTKMYQNKDLQTMNQLYNTPAVGASGAVYGVLAAFGLYFKDAKLALIFLPIPIAAKYFIPVMIFGDLFFGMTKYSVGNIAHFAHIGGALIGFIIAYSWKKNQFKTT